MRKYWKWIAAALVLAGVALAVWRPGSGQKDTKVLATAEVKMGEVRKVLQATGIVKAQVGAIVRIGARATGTIKEMRVRVGDPVTAGQTIALIDDRELQAQRDQAEATMEKAQAERQRVLDVYPRRIAESDAQLKLAEAQYDYAKANSARQTQLLKQNLVARDTQEAAMREELVTFSTVRARKATLDLAKTEFLKEKIKADKAVEEAEAGLATIETRISYTKIVSPIDGVVSLVSTQQGETVVAGLQVANLITVLDPTRLEMWIYVDETDVGQVKPDMPVEFRVDAYPDTVFKGVVDTIYPQPEIRDNIVYYQALVRLGAEKATMLRPEMTTQCQVVVQEKANVLTIPNSALKWVDNQQAVFLVEDGKAIRVQPELGLSGLHETEVIKGLTAGQLVATQILLPSGGKKPSPQEQAGARPSGPPGGGPGSGGGGRPGSGGR
ncbi:efflux RND transporter periplasmic adaptor subunit [Fundidesulfovibrio putealis]|uniref:efflux RND transporter periplasmic adaptor subunit n=1 Tax=Fundidesulfovibrio putealis TaxID=270496 RepID=UPI0003FE790A|nr:HlyD family efflux transporter periplasmic adaptor subunit [Fundidesulfovibrio putealis]